MRLSDAQQNTIYYGTEKLRYFRTRRRLVGNKLDQYKHKGANSIRSRGASKPTNQPIWAQVVRSSQKDEKETQKRLATRRNTKAWMTINETSIHLTILRSTEA
jgi:hypothetical protein